MSVSRTFEPEYLLREKERERGEGTCSSQLSTTAHTGREDLEPEDP